MERVFHGARTGKSPESLETEWTAVEKDLDRLLDAEGPHWTSQETADRVADALESLEVDARDVLGDLGRDARESAVILPVLRMRCQSVRQIVRATTGKSRRDEVPLFYNEIQDIEHDLLPHDPGVGKFAVLHRAPRLPPTEAVYVEVVAARAKSLFQRAVGIKKLGADDFDDVFRLWRAGAAVRGRVAELSDEAARDLRREDLGLADECARLERLLTEAMHDRSADLDCEEVAAAVHDMMDEIDDARLLATEPEPPPDVVMAKKIADATAFLRGARRFAARQPNGPVEKKLRRNIERLASSLRRFSTDRADRVLKARLNRLFGPKTVRVWDRLIFFLVIVALFFIVVDHYVDEAEHELPWYTIGDSAVCVVLLLDFFVRVLLTPRRISYFLRYSLTGFFAFLPFGLLANLERVPFFRSPLFAGIADSLRILRAVQPLVAFLRFVLFMTRAADRVVEALSWVLNKNIVFFAEAVKGEDLPTLVKRSRDLDRWIRRSTARFMTELPDEERREAALFRLRLIGSRVRRGVVGACALRRPDANDRSASELDAEEVIRSLRELDETNVHDSITADVAVRLLASMRFIRMPIIRRLPVVRYIIGQRGENDAAGIVARVSHVAADLLDLAQKTIHWFADLYGTITGSQFLDRLGRQIIKATARPAKRLIIFGVIAGIAVFLVKLMRFDFLSKVATMFSNILSTPVLVLGVLCLIPLVLGLWLRKIAGTAADFHDRVAEAQFLSLTEVTKEELAPGHLKMLAERVILPEARLGRAISASEASAVIETVQTEGSRHPFMTRDPATPNRSESTAWVDWNRVDFMLLYYRDFIDGAFFHRSDTKIANMILGNLTLENVRRDRLRYTPAQKKRLESLDIARAGGGLTGPYVWFNFITNSISQRTARLIIEYNENCIPLDEWDASSPEDRARLETWLARRADRAQLERRGVPTVSQSTRTKETTLSYRTTEFTALHFLGLGERRDRAVRRRFGNRIADQLIVDREMLIRGIFGTFPMHELPAETRTFNPYEFYRRFFSRGRIFLSPFVLFWVVLKGIKRLVAWVVRVVREVIRPDLARRVPVGSRSRFDVARRKIYRMRRPIVLEAVRLRAAFDVEYLGLQIPQQSSSVAANFQTAADLRLLNASEREWEEFRVLKSRRERELRLLGMFLKRVAERRPKSVLVAVFADRGAEKPETIDELRRRAESARAVTTAFVVDHASVATLIDLEHQVDGVRQRMTGGTLARSWVRVRRRPDKKIEAAVEVLWPAVAKGEAENERLKRRFVRELVRDKLVERDRVLRAAATPLGDSRDALDRAIDALESVAERPGSWTEQMVAVRTVQALAVIDVTGYEEVVRRLGNFTDEESTAIDYTGDKARL